jgi:DNA mismatch repair protein MutL
MSRIRVLDDLMVAMIAAGEVVERPASVLKELIENAIDAEATLIQVWLSNGGLDLIQVDDNGGGMEQEDLPLAMANHATSKISLPQHLEQVASFGFRGEALSSIASVAEVRLTSRFSGAEFGYEVRARQGKVSQTIPAARAVGTRVEVHGLFSEIPARRKFLKSMATEWGHCSALLQRIALNHPHIEFQVTHQDKLVHHWMKADTDSRVREILGQDFYETSARVEEANGQMSVTGWLQRPTKVSGSSGQIFLYVNRRFVRDKFIQHAVRQVYQDILHEQKNPSWVLFLEVPADSIDVNVHPAKTEIRFRDTQAIHQFIFRTLTKVFAQPAGSLESKSNGAVLLSQGMQVTPNIEYGGQKKENYSGRHFSESQLPLPLFSVPPLPGISSREAPVELEKMPYLGQALAQIDGIFLLAINQQGLILVDMHAAHERILYETFKKQGTHVVTSIQQLLIPVTLKANSRWMSVLSDHEKDLQELGFSVAPLGTETIVIRAVPAILAKYDVGLLVEQVLEEFSEYGNTRVIQEKNFEVLASLACRRAVKAQHLMTIPEMNDLLRQMEQVPRADQCNHGRPTWVQVTRQELDRWFMRGQ